MWKFLYYDGAYHVEQLFTPEWIANMRVEILLFKADRSNSRDVPSGGSSIPRDTAPRWIALTREGDYMNLPIYARTNVDNYTRHVLNLTDKPYKFGTRHAKEKTLTDWVIIQTNKGILYVSSNEMKYTSEIMHVLFFQDCVKVVTENDSCYTLNFKDARGDMEISLY